MTNKAKKYRAWRIVCAILSALFIVAPNLIYLGINFPVFKEANVTSLTLIALLIFAIVGFGALTKIKAKGSIWTIIIGVAILALANIHVVLGWALVIEGAGIAIYDFILKPLITHLKTKELKENGESVTYTREI